MKVFGIRELITIKEFAMRFNCFGIVLLVFIVNAGFCAPKTDPALTNAPIEYIVPFDGITQEELFVRSRLWIAETYNSAESVMTFDDEVTKTIKGTAIGTIGKESFQYHLSIELKNGKARIVFSSIEQVANRSF